MSDNSSRHWVTFEIAPNDVLRASSLMSDLRDRGILKPNANLNHFYKECMARGFNDYLKDLGEADEDGC